MAKKKTKKPTALLKAMIEANVQLKYLYKYVKETRLNILNKVPPKFYNIDDIDDVMLAGKALEKQINLMEKSNAKRT